MIINQEGMRYTYNGMTYTVGAAVMATEASEYRGLYGTITEIRDSVDRETENDTPDIYSFCMKTIMFYKLLRDYCKSKSPTIGLHTKPKGVKCYDKTHENSNSYTL